VDIHLYLPQPTILICTQEIALKLEATLKELLFVCLIAFFTPLNRTSLAPYRRRKNPAIANFRALYGNVLMCIFSYISMGYLNIF
jgi:hypothetical protein